MAVSNPTLAAIRFGYGLRPGEAPPADAEAVLAQVAAGVKEKPGFPRDGVTGRIERATRLLSVKTAEAKAAQGGKPNESIRREMEREANQIFRQDAIDRLGRAIHSPLGFYERLASFWANHFSIGIKDFIPMGMIAPLHEAQAIRPNIGGRFSKLLQAAVLHPAMLISVEGARPAAPVAGRQVSGLSEALAHRLLAVHTLGDDGGFRPEDVQGASGVLSGVAIDYHALSMIFEPRQVVAGPHVVLDRTYSGEEGSSQDHILMIEDLAANPKTALHICRKLAQHFLSDEPPEEVMTAMTGAWGRSQGDLTEVYRAMLTHPRAWSQQAEKIKTPFEFVASGLRALDLSERSLAGLLRDMETEADGPVSKALDLASGVDAEDRRTRAERSNALTLGALQRMGQPIWQPPGDQGFADNVAGWLTPDQLRLRIEWARLVGTLFAQRLEPTAFLDAALADAARPETRSLVAEAPNRMQAIAMVLASPEFNRR